MPMNPWHVTTDKLQLRRLGKSQEELGELQTVLARCIIQGIDEHDPATGISNRERLWKEIADVQAQLGLLVRQYELPRDKISTRISEKTLQMAEWEKVLRDAASTSDFPDDYEV